MSIRKIEAYDYFDIQRCVEKKLGRDTREFWRHAIDNIFYNITNGCIRRFNPYEELESVSEDDSIKEFLKTFIEVFEENNLPKEIYVELSW